MYNFLEKLWYVGTIDRTCFHDVDIFDRPYGFSSNGTLYIHETGKNDDAQNLKATLKTSEFDIGDGDKLMFIDRIIPDHTIEREFNYQINYKKYPQGTESFEKGPFRVTPSTRKFHPRIRGRQASITYSTSVQGSDFRLGSDRISIKPDGER